MTQNQLIELFESEHVKALIERAEEHGGQLEAPELEAFVLEHDIGEEDAELLQRELEAHNIEIQQPDVDEKDDEAPQKQYEAGPVAGAADSLQLLLQSLGQDAYAVYDGETALQAIERLHPQVVILDIGMPGMSGYLVAEELRQRHGDAVPALIAVTGWGGQKDRNQAFARGFDCGKGKVRVVE